ncbi:MAG TPA: SPOR domain-containing protein [Bacteroidia bacterium]|nr:SPOR domain-containing protein [Bacteroidia bacterium]
MLIRIKNISLFILLAIFTLNSVAQSSAPKKEKKKEKTDSDTTNNPPRLGDVFKPTIGLGAGTLSYFGNIYPKGQQFQSMTQSRLGYNLNLSQPLTKSLSLNFYVMFGKLGANERSATPALNQNFESQIRLGGLQLMYDFSNFIKKQNSIRPYVLTGFEGFEFLSKTDLYDKHGNKYYYWNDGTIKNMAQGSPGSQNAQTLVRDYTYDSDIREMNQNGYGKYRESSWAIPVGAGFTMNAGEHIKFRMGATMHFTFTNHIDGVASTKSDQFLMFAASVHYDLVTHKKDGLDTLPSNQYEGVDFLAIDNGDEDGDGVKDFDDLCHGTPAGAKVDAHGCPVDEDKDLVADYRDEELPTNTGKVANDKGIAMTDEDHQNWYNRYYDSTGQFSKVVDLGGPVVNGKAPIVNSNARPKDFTVELVRYKGGIPPDEMAYLLSIGDIRSFNYNDTTVVYAAGSYDDVRKAIKRRDEYISEGLKSARVGYFKGEAYFNITDAELAKELAEASKKGAIPNDATANNNSTSNNTEGAVNKGIIYRVQLGAYKNKLSPTMFKHAGKVLELKTEDGYYKYASGAYKTLTDAAAHKAELVYEGYEDAFITAYEKGKRVALDKVGATFEDKTYKENLSETANAGSAIDKSLVIFKIQLGLKKPDDTSLDEQLKELKDVDKNPTPSGLIRITAGEFKDYKDAVNYKNTLAEKGIMGAFVIGTFKGEVISIQEALDLLK